MRIRLDYGRDGLWVDVPDANLAAVLGIHPVPPIDSAPTAVQHALAFPIGAPPLLELARGKRSACVVISDITRPVPNSVLLPPILSTIESAGVPRSAIVILNATGTHRGNTPEELRQMVGDQVFGRYRIENHDARDDPSHLYLGDTPRGVPMWVDRRFVEAELRVSSALIEPHFMAGYSGGRKNICPGICSMETVKVWHGPRFIGHDLSESGSVNGNPVHEDSLFTARSAGLHFICDVTLDEQRRITGIFAGDVEAAWLEGTRRAAATARAPITAPVEIVITTCAGYPLDLTLYQAVKGMVGAIPILRPGGTLIIAARCAEGIGSREFAETLLDEQDLEAFVRRTYEPGFFVPDQWEVHELWKATRNAEILMFTEGIEAAQLSECFIRPVSSVEAGISEALDRHGPSAKIAVIPKGPYVLPYVGQGGEG